jgi:hypothetical protein
MRYLAAVSLLAGLACGDYTAPTSPPLKKVNLRSPVSGSFSRYILISGVWTCIDDACDDSSDPQAKVEGLPSAVDSLAISVDSLSIDLSSPFGAP